MSDKVLSLADARKEALKDTAARQRLAALFDPETFTEIGGLVKTGCDGAGVVTGCGLIEGAPVYAFSQDISEKSGAVGQAHGSKIKKLYDLAYKTGAPVVGIYDSNGAAVAEGLDAMAAYGEMLCWSNNLSGVVPQVSLVLGVCAGPAAMLAASADFVVMSEQAEFFLNAGDEDASDGEACAKAGIAHLVEKDEASAIASARRLLSMLPCNNLSAAPICDFSAPSAAVNAKGSLWEAIRASVDDGSLLELQEGFCTDSAKVGLATMAGSTIGVVAASENGVLTSGGCTKIARFVTVCDSFQIPVVTFVDCEKFAAPQGHCFKGGVREVAKLAHVYAEATTPKVAVIAGKAYGSAYIALAGRGANADYAIAWPNAVISALSPATAVAFMKGAQITAEKDRAAVEAEYAATEAGALAAAAKGHIDDVVDPSETRGALITALDMLAGKRVSTLPKKHGNIPL